MAHHDSGDEPVLVEHECFHHVIAEVDGIRVIEAVLPVGSVTALHTHTHENVAVTVEPGLLWAQDAGGPRVDYDAYLGRIAFKQAPYTHWVGNRGGSPVRIVHIDCPDASGDPAPGTPRLDAATEHDNDSVRVVRLAGEPGSTVPAHDHGIPVSLVVVAGRATLNGRTLGPGDVACRRDGRMPAIASGASERVQLVEIAWKRLAVRW